MSLPEPGAQKHPELVIGQTITVQASGNHPELTITPERAIGSGSFGVVFLARLSPSGEPVAVKKVLQDRRYKNRELQIMKELNHPNILHLRHFFFSSPANRSDELYLNLVLNYVPETVYSILKQYSRLRQHMPLLLVRLFAYQLCRSLAYCHQKGICHRDIKPQNLLIDPLSGSLILCDFGSAKALVKGEPNVSYICSRYYRAPELIFGATHYSFQIDMWSAGCVVAELLLGQPLFPGETGVEQLVEIIRVLGTPTREDIQEMNRSYTNYKFPSIKPYPWSKVFRSRVPADALDFISKLLVYKPQERFTATEALLHPFFDKLRDPETRLPTGSALPPLFDFQPSELEGLSQEQIDKLIPPHARQNTTE
ncbi:hypothetical protein KIPB_002254 [Kipferlia bialata]|uniref:Protein kinase domain-containing protein n=1 Tax=Kipferlia bialata TaxID=797122 RepID=A0A9K3GFZ6_9EUKA|nr:hypothetical protein KIPB_002254 [Kipferlia bialata]|eukprot:g2254.t1